MEIVDILRVSSAILYGFCIFLYGDKLLQRRTGKLVLFLVVGIISTLFSISSLTTSLIPFLYIGMYLTLFILFRLYFEGTKMMQAFAAGNFIFHLLCLKGIIISASSLLLRTQMYDLVNDSYVYTFISTLLFVISTVFLQVFQLFYSTNKIKKILKDAQATKILFYIQLGLNIFLLLTSIVYYFVDISVWLSIYHLLISFMVLIGFYIMFQYLIKNIQAKESKENVNNLKQQVNLEVKRYESQVNYIQSLRHIKHDYMNQIAGLEYVLINNGKDSALEYLNDINKEFKKIKGVYQTYSDHTLLNTLLQEYAQICLDKHINFKALLYINELHISDLNLCTLFSNLLDNAVEASLKVKKQSDRFIEIGCRMSGCWKVVFIENNFNGILLESDGGLKSTKECTEEHGLGVKRVKEIMEENGGMIHYEANEEKRTFFVQLMFPSILV